jgi:hypothetical protein
MKDAFNQVIEALDDLRTAILRCIPPPLALFYEHHTDAVMMALFLAVVFLVSFGLFTGMQAH